MTFLFSFKLNFYIDQISFFFNFKKSITYENDSTESNFKGEDVIAGNKNIGNKD